MGTDAIIRELECIERDAQAYMLGLEMLRKRSYSLRKRLESVDSPASPKGKKEKKAAADSSHRFNKKMAAKLNNQLNTQNKN